MTGGNGIAAENPVQDIVVVFFHQRLERIEVGQAHGRQLIGGKAAEQDVDFPHAPVLAAIEQALSAIVHGEHFLSRPMLRAGQQG